MDLVRYPALTQRGQHNRLIVVEWSHMFGTETVVDGFFQSPSWRPPDVPSSAVIPRVVASHDRVTMV